MQAKKARETPEWSISDVLSRLGGLANPRNLEGMARFGIPTHHALGISAPVLKKLAREIGKNHELAQDLWKTGLHEARCLAALVDDPREVTEAQMERWVKDFEGWSECDCCCLYLFRKTPWAVRKAAEWTRREEEFVRRAGFAMMAVLAVHDKPAKDEQFARFFPLMKKYAADERNFVKKAVNWALRQIGKRNLRLNQAAIRCAEQIRKVDSRSARWIAADALRELRSAAVQKRLRAEKSRDV